MISCEDLFDAFKENDLTFFTGIPDSTFKWWVDYLEDNDGKKLTHILSCNECEATAISTGYYLATGKIGVVYMQNSGLGKCVNPLTSLADKEVYSIPLLLMIGWRGEPNKEDEPQHRKMGRITIPLLETLEIPHKIFPEDIEEAKKVIKELKEVAEKSNSPTALIIKENLFNKYIPKEEFKSNYELSREEAINIVINNLGKNDIIVSTTGKTSRELFECRITKGEEPRDFYTVGSMGCSASIAFSIALEKPRRKVFIFDGDGAALMQLGSFATIGHYKPRNLCHILFNNFSYDSTGGQPTYSSTVDFEKIAISCGYKNTRQAETKEGLEKAITDIKEKQGPNLIVVKLNTGSRENLGRPTKTPLENKKYFMEFLK